MHYCGGLALSVGSEIRARGITEITFMAVPGSEQTQLCAEQQRAGGRLVGDPGQTRREPGTDRWPLGVGRVWILSRPCAKGLSAQSRAFSHVMLFLKPVERKRQLGPSGKEG